jgi:hypothetical protein
MKIVFIGNWKQLRLSADHTLLRHAQVRKCFCIYLHVTHRRRAVFTYLTTQTKCSMLNVPFSDIVESHTEDMNCELDQAGRFWFSIYQSLGTVGVCTKSLLPQRLLHNVPFKVNPRLPYLPDVLGNIGVWEVIRHTGRRPQECEATGPFSSVHMNKTVHFSVFQNKYAEPCPINTVSFNVALSAEDLKPLISVF